MSARTKVSGEWREAVKKWTTWPSACTPASVRPLAFVAGRAPVSCSSASSRTCLNGPQTRLALPAVKVGAVVAEGELDVPHRERTDAGSR